MIPQIIHIVWIGPNRRRLTATADAWRHANPDWSVMAWNEDHLRFVIGKAAEHSGNVTRADLARHLANVCRWYLLDGFGGVWVDVDTRPLLPLDPLISDRPFTAAAGQIPTPFICGGPPNHRLWKAALDASLDDPNGTSVNASGGRMLARVIEGNEIDLWPMTWFTDKDANGRRLRRSGPRYATHTWTTSRKRHREAS